MYDVFRSGSPKNPGLTVFACVPNRAIVISQVSALIQLLLSSPADDGKPAPDPGARVLAITSDLAFYADVLNAATTVRLSTGWARNVSRALEICSLRPAPVIVYDARLRGIEWRRAFDLLSLFPCHPRILLAADRIDETLWHKVLEHRGYDVVERSAGAHELARAFRFAWLSLHTPAAL